MFPPISIHVHGKGNKKLVVWKYRFNVTALLQPAVMTKRFIVTAHYQPVVMTE